MHSTRLYLLVTFYQDTLSNTEVRTGGERTGSNGPVRPLDEIKKLTTDSGYGGSRAFRKRTNKDRPANFFGATRVIEGALI